MFRDVWLFRTGQERGRVYPFGWEALGAREILREEPEEIISYRIYNCKASRVVIAFMDMIPVRGGKGLLADFSNIW